MSDWRSEVGRTKPSSESREAPAVRWPHRFAPEPWPPRTDPWQSARCAANCEPGNLEPDCTHISWRGIFCELHQHRGRPVLPPDEAALVGPTNKWARQEDR
jgi:hypothetical protein